MAMKKPFLALGLCVALVGGCSHQTEQQVNSANTQQLINNPVSHFIVVDQFGYLPEAEKIAIVRSPQQGFDAQQNYTPASQYKLLNVATNELVFTAKASAWQGGATAAMSGDQVWWIDFSQVTEPGRYALIDTKNNLRSPSFTIAEDVYKPVLKQAVRTFYYQRAGFSKQQPYAEKGWEDGASHLKPGQDTQARLFTDKNNAATERDLSGGWFDAGDYNKYTNWHADYLVGLLHAYSENPAAWGDDFNIPESGNGIADIIDEVKWGFDWLQKMQNSDGSVLSVMALSHASPPSSATGPSYYGPASTSATLSSAAAFALGAKIFRESGNAVLVAYGNQLQARAETAWQWAQKNPQVIVHNNNASKDARFVGLAAGDQEVDDKGREIKNQRAAIYLFAATGRAQYHDYLRQHYQGQAQWADIWNEERLSTWLYYTSLARADKSLAATIKQHYAQAMNDASNLGAITGKTDAYRAFIGDSNFTWGSNRSMSRKGSSFMNLISYSAGDKKSQHVSNAALGYLHYLHGTNPLGMVYLSNMYSLGVHSSVNEFYHSWFTNGSKLWDRVGESTYGPAPGFLVGGPNPYYNWDSCCPNSCGAATNNAVCTSISIVPPKGQPPMKSYLDFNTSWPLNSWEVSENHNDYQVAYIRLLSKFVK